MVNTIIDDDVIHLCAAVYKNLLKEKHNRALRVGIDYLFDFELSYFNSFSTAVIDICMFYVLSTLNFETLMSVLWSSGRNRRKRYDRQLLYILILLYYFTSCTQ